MIMKKKRGFARNYNGGPITVYRDGSRDDGGKAISAMMNNYSVDGMNFISDFEVAPGSDITIDVLNSMEGSPADLFSDFCAEVVWCERLSDDSGFAAGVRFKNIVDQ